MAVLYINEYAACALDKFGRELAAPKEPAIATQHIAIGGSSVASAAFNAATHFVLIHTDAICSVMFSANDGTTPTAVTTAGRMGANETRFAGVDPGALVAVISNS